ncbi:hypothetical protein GTO10_00665, partial [Candidatus Saccharibacteria bacterium]|nr:hypothetical protein [Candidatus Saccharibacteria bacterium]
MPVLKRGSKGSPVGSLQKALNKRKIVKPPLAVDKVFGPLTLDAVKRFQKSKGLKVDGLAGPNTLGELGLV